MDRNNRANALFRSPVSDSQNLNPTRNARDSKLKREWDTPTRVRVKTLREIGMPRKDILEQTNVPIRTQRLWRNQGYRRSGADRPGARKILSRRDLRTMIRHLTKSYKTRQSTWQQLATQYGNECHADTVKNALNNLGYHKCKACQMTFLSDNNITNRLHFAKKH